MARYLLRRLFSGVVVLFLFVNAMFFAIQLVDPGDYVTQFYWVPKEEKDALRAQLGLDLPIGQRWLKWLGDIARGDLGDSYTLSGRGQPVIDVLDRVVAPTILVFGVGTALAFLLGEWLGKSIAWRGPGVVSGGASLFSILLYTSFPPWFGFLITYAALKLFDYRAGQFSRALWRDAPLGPSAVMWQMIARLVAIVLVLLLANALLHRRWRRRIPTPLFLLLAAGAWVGSWALAGWWPLALDVAKQAALPLLVFTLLSFGEVMLVMRSTMADTLHEEYVKAARAKGLPPRTVRDRHAARTALLPVLSRSVTSIPYLLTGMAMIEEAVAWPGIGTTLFDAFAAENMPVAIGALLVIGVISLGTRLLLDVLTGLLDPRIRAHS